MAGPPSGISVAGAEVAKGAAEFVAGAIDHVSGGPAPDLVEYTLDNTQLPDPLLRRLEPHLKRLSFLLDPQPRKIRDFGGKVIHHHRVRVKEGGYVALLHIGNKVLENGAYAQNVSWIVLPFPRNGAVAVTIFSDAERVEPVYSTTASEMVKMTSLKTAEFVSEIDISDFDDDDLEGKKDRLKKWMGLDGFTPAATFGSSLTLKALRKNTDEARSELKRIREILVTNADLAPSKLGAKGYMRFLINLANWPEGSKGMRVGALTGIAEPDALELVNWAVKQGGNPEVEGYTIIGGLLEAMIGQKLETEFLKGIIAKYSLVPVSSFLKME